MITTQMDSVIPYRSISKSTFGLLGARSLFWARVKTRATVYEMAAELMDGYIEAVCPDNDDSVQKELFRRHPGDFKTINERIGQLTIEISSLYSRILKSGDKKSAVQTVENFLRRRHA